MWEENEFWIDLSWKIDPDGSMGIRKWFESDERPGHPISVDEYYGHIFAEEVPGLADAAADAGQTPLEYMRDRGAFAVPTDPYTPYEKLVRPTRSPTARRTNTACTASPARSARSTVPRSASPTTELAKLGDGSPAVEVDGEIKEGFPTPSKKLELFSTTLKEWGWPEYSTPKWIPSHVHWEDMDMAGNERILLPTFRIPTLIHTRSANSKWLNEISHRHPLWIHPEDAEKLDIEESGLVRISTRHRPLRDPGVADRGHSPRRRRRLASHGPLASRRDRRPQLGRRQGDHRPSRRRPTVDRWKLRAPSTAT